MIILKKIFPLTSVKDSVSLVRKKIACEEGKKDLEGRTEGGGKAGCEEFQKGGLEGREELRRAPGVEGREDVRRTSGRVYNNNKQHAQRCHSLMRLKLMWRVTKFRVFSYIYEKLRELLLKYPLRRKKINEIANFWGFEIKFVLPWV